MINGSLNRRQFLSQCSGLASAGLLAGCVGSPGAEAPLPDLDVQIGRMLMAGFRGMAVDPGHPIVADISRRHLGGVILFDYDVQFQKAERNIRSPEQLKALTAQLQAITPDPLLIAVDQEGGRVARLKEAYGFDATRSHADLGAAGDLRQTCQQAEAIARTLAAMGINLNMAPVVDLCVNPDNPVIARLGRCFSADPVLVADHAAAFIRAHHAAGVACCLKHFPGHGSSTADSHLGLTDVTETWTPAELEPYRRLIDAGLADAVMTAHVFNARRDPDAPATLSSATIQGLLRNQLGFDGVVLSDDLQMGAITRHYGLETAVQRAVDAGVDLLVFGNNLDYDPHIVQKAAAIIHRGVRAGTISPARIQRSYRRIQRLQQGLKYTLQGSQCPPANA